MLALVPVVVGLALLDSINPSAIGVALLLMMSREHPVARVAAYMAGVVGVYLAVGISVLAGLSALSPVLEKALNSFTAWLLTGLLGLGMFVYSWTAPKEKERHPRSRNPAQLGYGGLVVLGAAVSVVEFSTAVPYLGAIAVLSRAELEFVDELVLLVLYNFVMSLPVITIVIMFLWGGERLRGRAESWHDRLRSGGRETFRWVIGAVGLLLVLHTVAHFEFFGLIDVPRTPPPTG